MNEFHLTGAALGERMNRAVEKVQERSEKNARTPENAGIPYAIIGGNAVRAWVAQKDEAAVRTIRDVDILLRRSDLSAATKAMQNAGFVYRHTAGKDMFLDDENAKARDALHVLIACGKIRETDLLAAPDVNKSVIVDAH